MGESRGALPRVLWAPRREGEVPTTFIEKFGRIAGPVLWARGMDAIEDAELFVAARLDTIASPLRLKEMKEAAERVADAIVRDEKIAVYADYDMDGMTGLALLVSFFAAMGREAIPYQPDRLAEGYGVHKEAIADLVTRGARVIITVDTGISAIDAALTAKGLGVDLIITDHHQQIQDRPEALFVVNPNQFGDVSGLSYLSGAGVAFYLALAVRSRLRELKFFSPACPEPDLKLWLDFFTLGTVADSVEIKGENRPLVRVGLKQLLNTKRPGLRALLEVCVPGKEVLGARDLAFSIAPKLNAASRMGKAHLSTELLLTQDVGRASDLVEEILELNEMRSNVQQQVFREALEIAQAQVRDLDAPVVVVDGEWHEGVLGIVAAKLVERVGRPAIVLSRIEDGRLRGSMRTLPHFSCIRSLEVCSDLLVRFGGHRMAAGMLLVSENLEAFREKLWAGARAFLSQDSVLQQILFDLELPAGVNLNDVELADGLGPWGSGNGEPLLRIRNLSLSKGTLLKEEHFKCRLANGMDLIAFFKGREIDAHLKAGVQDFDALVIPEINRFRNNKTIQLRLEHIRPSENSSS